MTDVAVPDRVEVIARLMQRTGKGEPLEYWLREAGEMLTQLDARALAKLEE